MVSVKVGAFITLALFASVILAPVHANDTGESGCVNVIAAQVGDQLVIYPSLNNVIGLIVSAQNPGDGVTFGLLIAPRMCQIGMSADLNTAAIPGRDLPPPPPGPSIPLLP